MKFKSKKHLGMIFFFILVQSVFLQATEGSFDSNGVKICFYDEGKGEPVILLHGGFANSIMNWKATSIMPKLVNGYRVIAMEMRGHGKSDKPYKKEDYGIKMVEDVINLIKHLDLKKTNIIGYSLGSQVALKLAVTYPEKIKSVILGGPGWHKPDDDLSLYTELSKSLKNGKGIGVLFKALIPEGEKPPSDEEIAKINKNFESFNDFKAMAACMEGVIGLTITEKKLNLNKIPCLVLIGSKDPNKKMIPAWKKAMPEMETVEIMGAGHGDAVIKPDFIGAIEKFLKKHNQKK